MTRDEALTLGDRICDFLVSCGGPYKRVTGTMQLNVADALGSQQYVMREENGEIVYFAAYWRVRREDVEGVMDRVKPLELATGSVMYVSEAGNKGGPAAMAEIVKRLRKQAPWGRGLFWHRAAKHDQVQHFPSQRGGEA